MEYKVGVISGDGATPGESKKKTTETSSSEESSYDGYDDYDYNQEENYGY